ncbi:MAG TPA: hypothetical protein VF540_12015 [Segetibacter sp.]
MKNIFSLLLVLVFSLSISGQNQTDSFNSKSEMNAEQLGILIEKIGQTVKKNLDSIVNVAFTEVIRQQQLKDDASPTGKPKSFVYESIVKNPLPTENKTNSNPIFTRTLKSINGKPIKNQPSLEDSKCEQINPQPAYDNPLSFLLPTNQPNYIFSYGGEIDFESNKTIIILVAEKQPTESVTIIEKNDCLFLSRPLQMKGKIWVNSKTFEVVKLHWQQAETYSATIPKKIVKAGIIPLIRPKITINYERQDFTVSFRPVKFQDPEQTLLLPYFSETVWINQGSRLAGMQTRIDYTQYRLFKTNVQISDSDKETNP